MSSTLMSACPKTTMLASLSRSLLQGRHLVVGWRRRQGVAKPNGDNACGILANFKKAREPIAPAP